MYWKYLIVLILQPFLLQQTCANSTVAALHATSNSTSTAPRQTSYFYPEAQGPQTYEFAYNIEDKPTDNFQFHNETGYSNGTATGTYGYLRADGIFTIINYIADEKGFRTINRKKNRKHHPIEVAEAMESSTIRANSTTEIPPINLTAGTLPPVLVDKVMDEFKIDLSPDASPVDILHPNISDIINGNFSLKMDKNSSQLGFDVVQNFIPSNFPIAPFQLPTDDPSKSKNG